MPSFAARQEPKRPEHERLIGDAWAACMDEQGVEKAGLAREVAVLHLALPGRDDMARASPCRVW